MVVWDGHCDCGAAWLGAGLGCWVVCFGWAVSPGREAQRLRLSHWAGSLCAMGALCYRQIYTEQAEEPRAGG